MLEVHFGVPAAGGVLVAVNNRLSGAEVGYILVHSARAICCLTQNWSRSSPGSSWPI